MNRGLDHPWLQAGFRQARRIYAFCAAGLVLAYACSGITFVRPDESALVFRFGRLHAADGKAIVYPPGLLLAFPEPFERVRRISVKTDRRIEIACAERSDEEPSGAEDVNGQANGPVITGDRQNLNVVFSAKYRVGDPVAEVTAFANSSGLVERIIRSAVASEVGSWSLDEALRLRRQGPGKTETLAENLRTSAQQSLDRLNSGIILTGIDIRSIRPPRQTIEAFEAVQSARIGQETAREEAKGTRAESLIEAEGLSRQFVAEAKGLAIARQASANADALRFTAEFEAYRQYSAAAVLNRLVREAWDDIVQAGGRFTFVPPDSAGQTIRLPLSTQGRP